MTTRSGDVPFAIDGQALSSVEQASESVGGPIQPETVLLIVGLAVVAVGVLGVLTYLYAARETLDREIEEIEAERRAFLAFAERVEGIPVQQSSAAMATPQTIQTFENTNPPVADVATAFEETVMSLPHYRETYGGGAFDQMAIEFDADLVASLHRPGSMSDTVKRGLTQHATDAAAKREDLLDILAEERQAVDEAESRFEPVLADIEAMNDRPLPERSYAELQDYYARLGELRTRIGEISRDRQRVIQTHKRTLTWNREAVTLQEYLYGGSSPTYPVLDTVTRLDRLIEDARARVSRALWSRV